MVLITTDMAVSAGAATSTSSGQLAAQSSVAAQASAATASSSGLHVAQAAPAVQAGAASVSSLGGLRVVQGDALVTAGAALTAIEGIMPNMILAFRIGGDPATEPVLVSLIDPAGEDYDGLSPTTGGYIRALEPYPPNNVVVVADVVIPDLLDITSEYGQSDEFQVYWLLQRWFSLPFLQQAVEPIRAKVADTQDISLVTTEELRLVRTLNALYNTDVDLLVQSATTVPAQ